MINRRNSQVFWKVIWRVDFVRTSYRFFESFQTANQSHSIYLCQILQSKTKFHFLARVRLFRNSDHFSQQYPRSQIILFSKVPVRQCSRVIHKDKTIFLFKGSRFLDIKSPNAIDSYRQTLNDQNHVFTRQAGRSEQKSSPLALETV